MTLAFMAAAITGCKGAVTPQDNTTIEDMTIDVTPENIVNTILTLPASRTLKATGNFDSTTIRNINAALKTLYQSSPSILVRLDLSDTTGLYYLHTSNYRFNPITYEDDKKELFVECKNLETIILPETVMDIKTYAFYNCTNLAKIVIPNSVDSIGDYAFSNCTSLTSITIPDSVTWIGNSAFYNCTGLTSITIPDSVTGIGKYAFYNCTGLTSITIPDSVTSLSYWVFCDCSSLTNVTIPASVTSIDNSFHGCSEIKTVYYTGTLEQWFSIDFSGPWSTSTKKIELYINNTKLEGNITIPDSFTSIGKYAFYGCTGLTSITIPDTVTSIGEYAFYGCIGLTSITIPDSVTSIGKNAFIGCKELTSATFNQTRGWRDSNFNLVSVADPEAAATLLKEGGRLTRSN